MKNKKILEYIKKYAQGAPTPPPPPPPPPAPEFKYDEAGSGRVPASADSYISAKTSPIARMQDEIISLGKYISSETKDFNDFMVEAYSNESYIRGEEWDPGQRYHTKSTRAATPLIRLDSVVDQLKKIGAQPAPIKADNVWDERTQNALKNTWAFADAIVRVYEDFGATFTNPQFTKSDLGSLSELIPKTPIDRPEDVRELNIKDKIELARNIIPYLEKLKNFYISFSKKILNNPIYRPFIKPVSVGMPSGQVPESAKIYNKFDIKMQPSKQMGPVPTLEAIEGKVLSNIKLTNVNDRKITVDVPLVVLKNQRNLEKFLYDKLSYPEDDIGRKDIQLKVLNEISGQIQ